MNRSIMIVICDFLVLCALSLSSGLSELPDTAIPETPGYRDGLAVVPGSQAVAASDYEALKARMEKLQQELASQKAGRAFEKETFSKADKAREAQLDEAEKKVSDLASKLFRTEKELKDAAGALLQARKKAAEQKKELQTSSQRVEDLKTALEATRSVTTRQDKEILWQRTQIDLIRKKQESTERKLEDSRDVAKKREVALAKADERIVLLNRDIARTAEELRQSRVQEANISRSLADVRGRLIQKTEESAGYQRLLAHTKKQLAEAEEKLVSISLEKYSSSAVRLDFSVTNIRPILGNNVYKNVQYIPEIRLGNRIWLPAALLPVTGLDRNFSGYTQVSSLSYLVSLPSGEVKSEKLIRDFLIPGNAPGLCLIPVKGISKKPLSVITWDKLKKRGLRNLTLFKVGQFGKASAELAERCSIDVAGKDKALFIRNAHRKGSELIAEPGDIVITKEGEYVGTVVGVAQNGSGRSIARCFVFPMETIPTGKTISLSKKQGEKFYNDFSVQTESLRRELKKTDPVYNR